MRLPKSLYQNRLKEIKEKPEKKRQPADLKINQTTYKYLKNDN